MDLDMYAETLIYNYEHPENKGKIDNPDANMKEENVSCGDKIIVYLKIENGRVKEAKFDGTGCVISMGSANMLIGTLKGKGVADIEKMQKEDLLKIIEIDPGLVRMHCATLSLRAIKEALFSYENKPADSSTKEL